MLFENTGVLDRHFPAGKRNQPRSMALVKGEKRRALEAIHNSRACRSVLSAGNGNSRGRVMVRAMIS